MPIAAAASNALKLKGIKKGGDGLKVTSIRNFKMTMLGNLKIFTVL